MEAGAARWPGGAATQAGRSIEQSEAGLKVAQGRPNQFVGPNPSKGEAVPGEQSVRVDERARFVESERGERHGTRGAEHDAQAPEQRDERAQSNEAPLALDPMLAILARPPSVSEFAAVPHLLAMVPAELLDQLAARVLRRCSVGREGATTTVRLELGPGRFEGASVLVQSEQGRVSVRIEGDDRARCQLLETVLRGRLRERGMTALDVSAT